MGNIRNDLTGQRFGRLTVICASRNKYNKRKYWECECDCGNITFAYTHALIAGKVKSCGCLKDEINTKHGGCIGKEERLYAVWRTMRQRCYDPHTANYKNYGARGIAVCDEWKNDYEAFRKWALANGYNETAKRNTWLLDRIDNNGNYTPENCRFVTPTVNSRNRRSTVKATINGETKPVVEWCEILNKDYNLVRGRLQQGWNIEDALYRPKQYQNRRRTNG